MFSLTWALNCGAAGNRTRPRNRTLTCGNGEFDDAKRRESTRNDLRIRQATNARLHPDGRAPDRRCPDRR